MKLENIAIGKLSVSALNMRHGKKAPDVSDILPSIRARGVLVPLLVRPVPAPLNAEHDAGNDGADTFEIVAGRRRFHAAQIVAQETGEADPLPCAIMEAGDDASALEASLIENIARLDPDEVSQWETYTRLIQKEGRTVEQIALTFGVTELMVKRVLALGNLLPRIRDLYRKEEINAATIRHLTLATKGQQKDWLALYDDPDQYAPSGQQLKAWLFGGVSIPVKAALFDVAGYKGTIITDLFGEDGYFADADMFWVAQNEAIAAKRDALLAAGWADVEVLETGDHFRSWEYEKTPKAKGGKVIIAIDPRGEVAIHEGYVSGKEAKKARAAEAKGSATEADKQTALAGKSEVSGPMQTYIDLHRHAAVRATLLDYPAVALRLMIAHAITGSPLWTVRIETQNARNDAMAESVETSMAEARFDEQRRLVLALLDFSPEQATVAGGNGDEHGTAGVFARLLALSDSDVLAVLAVVMGETLMAGSAVVEAVGNHIGVDMAALWTPDDVFFDLMRDRQVVNAMLRDVGGKRAADGNVAEKVKTQKAVIRDFLGGTNKRKKVENWTPGWLRFPAASYTARPFATLAKWKKVEGYYKGLPAPKPAPVPALASVTNTPTTDVPASAIHVPEIPAPEIPAPEIPAPEKSATDMNVVAFNAVAAE